MARLQLDANTATGFAQLEVASTDNCWLQNRLSGAAPLIVETNGVITTTYGQNDLSDVRLKTNIADADLEKLQAIFDAAAPKRHDRVDVGQRGRLGFLAQDFEGTGVTGTTFDLPRHHGVPHQGCEAGVGRGHKVPRIQAGQIARLHIAPVRLGL